MDQESHGNSSSPPTTYAFMNHSQDTLVNKLPPDVDNKPLARQKRKRTSPEDQAVLEDAYSRDPKPDKEARLKLVEKIALGEKEVQIWFQNRRQTSRRKSRPLLPHEIAQFQISRYGASADDGDHVPTQHDSSPEPSSSLKLCSDDVDTSQTSIDSVDAAEQALPEIKKPMPDDTLAPRTTLPSLNQVLDNLTRSAAQPLPPTTLRKSASFIRLSMTSEGRAKVVTKNTSSPSPPRPLPQDEIATSAHDTSPTRRSLKRSASGRSRDSRAWEFWCDKDNRTELEEKAEKDVRGSAADAIGLMRANNVRRALQPMQFRQNAMLSRQHLRHSKSAKTAGKRPSLSRAHTSEGRLQSAVDSLYKKKRVDHDMMNDNSVHIPGNESDKENWSPRMLSSSQDAGLKQSKHDTENVQPEVAALMKRGRNNAREELDCVQGLLSLSQGNWAS